MKTYRVGAECIICDEVYVEAENEQEAIKLAEKELNRERYDHYTIDYVEEE